MPAASTRGGSMESIMSRSRLNRFNVRPLGVASNQPIGALKTLRNTLSCRALAVRTEPAVKSPVRARVSRTVPAAVASHAPIQLAVAGPAASTAAGSALNAFAHLPSRRSEAKRPPWHARKTRTRHGAMPQPQPPSHCPQTFAPTLPDRFTSASRSCPLACTIGPPPAGSLASTIDAPGCTACMRRRCSSSASLPQSMVPPDSTTKASASVQRSGLLVAMTRVALPRRSKTTPCHTSVAVGGSSALSGSSNSTSSGLP
mmetsp:Transcript_39710/g.126294  ORF Transcript_39710/g.126294 Transcript_39710/m.126294 type:complete len:258 (-) Transcript_39710:378-1151(-)